MKGRVRFRDEDASWDPLRVPLHLHPSPCTPTSSHPTQSPAKAWKLMFHCWCFGHHQRSNYTNCNTIHSKLYKHSNGDPVFAHLARSAWSPSSVQKQFKKINLKWSPRHCRLCLQALQTTTWEQVSMHWQLHSPKILTCINRDGCNQHPPWLLIRTIGGSGLAEQDHSHIISMIVWGNAPKHNMLYSYTTQL